MSGAFLKSVAFGLAVAASIGPIALLIIGTAATRGLRPGRGWRRSINLAGAAGILQFGLGGLVSSH